MFLGRLRANVLESLLTCQEVKAKIPGRGVMWAMEVKEQLE